MSGGAHVDWAEDPELLAAFRAEVAERLASLTEGLLSLEGDEAPRSRIAALFRDAHTIKGSARMLGAEEVLRLAHGAEDTLAALRDGRVSADRALIDGLLATCDAIGAAVGEAPAPAAPPQPPAPAAPAPRAPAPAPPPAPASPPAPAPADAVRVPMPRVHTLLDGVGEAELASRAVERGVADLLAAAGPSPDVLAAARALQERSDAARGRWEAVREAAGALALVPVHRITAGLPRLVRDAAAAGGKQVRLVVEGDDVEADKQVLDALADPLAHLVTNAVDHGCEAPERRRAAGKPETATVTVRAATSGGTVTLSVSDDGAGVDRDRLAAAAARRGLLPAGRDADEAELLRTIFAPGLTTATTVTARSGRGVGMDVVAAAAEALGGSVDIASVPGAGTTVTVAVPVSLGVLSCLLARVGDERYALPVAGVAETLSLRDAEVHHVAGAPVVVRHGASLPLVDLGAALGVPGPRDPRVAVVAGAGRQAAAWAVDAVDGPLDLVVRDPGTFLGRRMPALLGASIDVDGAVVFIVDLRELAARPAATAPTATATPSASAVPDPCALANGRPPTVLVVEDSVGVRELERLVLEAAGYEVQTAVDGLEGAARLGGEPVDLVISDVEMPGMDGFALTRTIRGTRGWEHVPVVIMTSRGDEADQREGLQAGANGYLLKNEFDSGALVDTVRRLVGR